MGVKPQDTNDAVKAGQGPFQPVSTPRTSYGVGPAEEGCHIWCVPRRAAWQHGSPPPWLHLRFSCHPATWALTHCCSGERLCSRPELGDQLPPPSLPELPSMLSSEDLGLDSQESKPLSPQDRRTEAAISAEICWKCAR